MYSTLVNSRQQDTIWSTVSRHFSYIMHMAGVSVIFDDFSMVLSGGWTLILDCNYKVHVVISPSACFCLQVTSPHDQPLVGLVEVNISFSHFLGELHVECLIFPLFFLTALGPVQWLCFVRFANLVNVFFCPSTAHSALERTFECCFG